jgi:CheY-like chemotaxis protein
MPTGKQLGRPVEVLHVEDSSSDATLIKLAFQRGIVDKTIHHVTSGEQALAFLRKEIPFQNVPRPDVILLDINLTGKSGHEVLQEVRADERLRQIPVVVLSSSVAEIDVRQAYESQVNAYLKKPMDQDELTATLQAFDNFFLSFVQLPPAPDQKP